MHKGFHFIWVPTKRPCMITPSMRIVPLMVRGDIPYLDVKDIEKYKNAREDVLFKATGVWIHPRDYTVCLAMPEDMHRERKMERALNKSTAAPAVDQEGEQLIEDQQGPVFGIISPADTADVSCNTDFSMLENKPNRCDLILCNLCGKDFQPAAPAPENSGKANAEGGSSPVCLPGESAETSGEKGSKEVTLSEADTTDVADSEDGESSDGGDSSGKEDKMDVISDRNVAIQARHCLLHRPFRPDCHACRLAKTIAKRHTKRVLAREVAKWGELLTCDHIVCHNWLEHKGLGGKSDVFSVYDFATSEIHGIPVNAMDTWDTIEALQFLAGDEYIHVVYADRINVIKKAVKYLHGMHKRPSPGNSQSNGVIESLNRRIQEGTRACLIQAGLPICWWSYAVQHWCFLRNTAPDATGISPYEKRRNERCKALPLPFGLGVYFCPNKTKYKHQHKFQSRLCYGILIGFGLNPGHGWDGTYLVVDLDHFVLRSLDEFADPKVFSRMKPHATQVIKTEVDGFRFPLCEEYERCNRTLQGRKEYYNDLRPASKELAKLDYSTKAECNRMMRIENPHLNPELLHKLHSPDQSAEVVAHTSEDTPAQGAGGPAGAEGVESDASAGSSRSDAVGEGEPHPGGDSKIPPLGDPVPGGD